VVSARGRGAPARPSDQFSRSAQQGGTRQPDAWAGRRSHRRTSSVVSPLLVVGLGRRRKLEGVSGRAPGKASSGGVHPRGVSVARGRSSGSEGASSGSRRSSGWSQLQLETGSSLRRLRKARRRQGRTMVHTLQRLRCDARPMVAGKLSGWSDILGGAVGSARWSSRTWLRRTQRR
jgi:hypothetical protein